MLDVVNLDTASPYGFFLSILPILLRGLAVTVGAALLGYVVALALGLIFALMRRSSLKWLSVATACILEFLRDTPLLIQLFFLYFVLPGYGIVLPPFAIGAIAIGLQYAAYLAEVYRGGLDAVPKGQWEAAISLNMSRRQIYRDVVIPQAVPRVVPVLGNYLASILKETPLLSTISLYEMFSLAVLIGDRTYEYIIPLSTAAGIMFIMTCAVSLFVGFVEHWLPKEGIPLR
jgi:polar amino acid transport system permease protein